jgi:hypothetical protein
VRLSPSLGAHVKLRFTVFLVLILFLIASCAGATQGTEGPTATALGSHYEYQVGLGYGFLGKAVRVEIDGREVLSMIGTDEIEGYAQRLGTKMLASGSSPDKDITVRVTVDGAQPYEQTIDLSRGKFIHIYYEQTGLRVFNTEFLSQE